MSFRTRLGCVAVLLCLGCGGSSGGPRLKTVPVKGTLTVDGKPFGPATVQLLPQEADAAKRKAAVGQADSSGKFVIGSYDKQDGAVPGAYDVRIDVDLAAGMAPAVDSQTVKVGPQGDENLQIGLKTRKGAGDLLSPKLQEAGASTKL